MPVLWRYYDRNLTQKCLAQICLQIKMKAVCKVFYFLVMVLSNSFAKQLAMLCPELFLHQKIVAAHLGTTAVWRGAGFLVSSHLPLVPGWCTVHSTLQMSWDRWAFTPGCQEHIVLNLWDRAVFWGPLYQLAGDGESLICSKHLSDALMQCILRREDKMVSWL